MLQRELEPDATTLGLCTTFPHDRNEVTPLDGFDHPALAGAAACLHGYAASAGDPVFLEKAYEMARTVAASKHDLSVVLDACRMALAVG